MMFIELKLRLGNVEDPLSSGSVLAYPVGIDTLPFGLRGSKKTESPVEELADTLFVVVVGT